MIKNIYKVYESYCAFYGENKTESFETESCYTAFNEKLTRDYKLVDNEADIVRISLIKKHAESFPADTDYYTVEVSTWDYTEKFYKICNKYVTATYDMYQVGNVFYNFDDMLKIEKMRRERSRRKCTQARIVIKNAESVGLKMLKKIKGYKRIPLSRIEFIEHNYKPGVYNKYIAWISQCGPVIIGRCAV